MFVCMRWIGSMDSFAFALFALQVNRCLSVCDAGRYLLFTHRMLVCMNCHSGARRVWIGTNLSSFSCAKHMAEEDGGFPPPGEGELFLPW